MALSNFTRPQLPYSNVSLANDDRFQVITRSLEAPPTDIMLDSEFNKVTDSLNILDAKLEGVVGGSIPGYNDPDNANFVLFTDGANQGWKLIADINCQTGSINANKLINSSVTNVQIQDGTINNPKMAPASVGTANIIDLNVTTAKIALNAVTTARIMDANVTAAKIADSAVTEDKIEDGAVTSDKIEDGAVISDKIQNSSVGTVKIVDASITLAKLAQDVLDRLVPIGTVVEFAGTTGFAANWLECIGQAVSRTTYATLFANLGTTYGAGNGTTTFNLPDRRGRVAVGIGADNSTGDRITVATAASIVLGGTFGTETHTLTIGEMPSHNHSNWNMVALGEGASGRLCPSDPTQTSVTSNTGGDGAHVNTQPSIFARYYIRAL